MNAILNLPVKSNGLAGDISNGSIHEKARKKSLHRLLQALLREGFLNRQDLVTAGDTSWLPLWSKKRMLRMEGLQLGRAGHCHIGGAIALHQSGKIPHIIDTSSELLSVLNTENTEYSAQAQQRLQTELENSVENDILCHQYRQEWSASLLKQILQAGQTSLWTTIVNDSNAITNHSALFFEQWGCIGHPFHPGHKSKTGLNAEQVLAYSPEFQPQLDLVIGAIKASVARISSVHPDFSYTQWMAIQYPTEMSIWFESLIKRGLPTDAWLPLPIHPYQAEHVLPEKFAAEIRAGLLLIETDFPRLRTSPTMSFRTVASSNNHLAPHLKLPLSLQLTSAQRTVSPKATIMGPRVSRLLRELIRRENGFDETLDILAEEVGLHFIDPNDDADRARHLSILFRENPMTRIQPGHLSVPVAALFADSPINGKAFVTELVASAFGDDGNGALSYFHDYSNIVLQASLSAYLIYGIAFEAHQQNSLVLLNKNGTVAQLLLRDFGDIRIYTPMLHSQGLQLENHQADHILFDDPNIVREKFLHTTMLCHLAELAVLLARSYSQHEDAYWQILYDNSAKIFEHVRHRCDPQRWEKERQAVMFEDWPVKSLLRMRLNDTVDDICLTMPNPLALFSVN
ncbi:IucA/IucC family siderophore biosynthesis protein [Undibacterium jejuense]|uniref:IucA/IucC family siderophore biosynthesis protein n=1 Tax=Undibacterium jejuense TaxID=1344949 RepID=A0A923HDP6_9BURK|nr:IucA/IucC family siderophore biosynthesis protein [Undibacterium jejuense]MBC3862126.1 IucA/IucC family siderophore biosynthesis protein [Undibacterium jejuense]